MTKRIEFRCSLPNIQSAIKFGADMARVTLDIPQSDVYAAIGLIALTNMPLRVTVEVDTGAIRSAPELTEKPKKEKKAKKPKGIHGKYWNILIGKNEIFYNRDLITALQTDVPNQSNPEQAIRDYFGVSSRSFISPEQFEEFLKKHHLDGLVTLSRQAAAKAAEVTV